MISSVATSLQIRVDDILAEHGGKHVGIAVGVSLPGETATFARGSTGGGRLEPGSDTIFEIGSITKVFTATLLALMVAIAGMTMSLDGFVEDEGGSASRLYPDLAALRDTDCLVDELRVDVMPILLGGGRRLFGEGAERIRLAKTGVQEVGARTSLAFDIVR